MKNFETLVRPILAFISIAALIWFYSLMTFGRTIPTEAHVFWVPIMWWFGERTLTKSSIANKQQELDVISTAIKGTANALNGGKK